MPLYPEGDKQQHFSANDLQEIFLNAKLRNHEDIVNFVLKKGFVYRDNIDNNATCFDSGMAEDVLINDFFEENPDSIIIKSGNNITCLSKFQLRMSSQDLHSQFYECKGPTLASIDKKTIYTKLPPYNTFVRVRDLKLVLESKGLRFFRYIYDKDIDRMVSRHVLESKDEERFVSGFHCQKGTNTKIYFIYPVLQKDIFNEKEENRGKDATDLNERSYL